MVLVLFHLLQYGELRQGYDKDTTDTRLVGWRCWAVLCLPLPAVAAHAAREQCIALRPRELCQPSTRPPCASWGRPVGAAINQPNTAAVDAGA